MPPSILLDLGHRRIGLISPPAGLSVTTERVGGYQAAFAELGHPLDEKLIVPGDFDIGAGAEAVRRLMQNRQKPTAIIASNDIAAFGAIAELHVMGLSVPKDVSVVGFDDIAFARVFQPGAHHHPATRLRAWPGGVPARHERKSSGRRTRRGRDLGRHIRRARIDGARSLAAPISKSGPPMDRHGTAKRAQGRGPMNYNLTRRTFLAGTAAAAALVAMPRAAMAQELKYKGELDVVGFVRTPPDQAWDALIKSFEAAHPGITVKETDYPSETYVSLFTAQQTAGQPADVLALNGQDLRRYATNGGARCWRLTAPKRISTASVRAPLPPARSMARPMACRSARSAAFRFSSTARCWPRPGRISPRAMPTCWRCATS